MDIERIHTPVMLERTLELLAPAISADGAVLVDATLGMGGHAAAVLERFPNLTVIGLDRDTDALAIARERLAKYGDRARFVHTVYDGIARSARMRAWTGTSRSTVPAAGWRSGMRRRGTATSPSRRRPSRKRRRR